MNPDKNKKSNYIELVPKLISHSQGLSTELKNRIKSNHLFTEFEARSSKQFNFFIKESEKRHLGSKYGAKIDYLLKASKKRGQKEAYKILHDKFYFDKELIKERKKMLKKSTNELHENIIDTINKIRGIKTTPNYLSDNDNNNNNSKNKMNKYRKKIKPLNDEILLLKNKNILDMKKNEINKVFHKEEENLKTFFNKYKTYLSEVNNTLMQKTETDNSITNISNKTLNSKINFSFPKMQLLNYTKSLTNVKSKKELDNENRINIKKLLQYSLSKKDIEHHNENYKKFYLTNPNKKDGFYNEMKNTNSLVFHKALNEYNSFRNKFNKKNDTIRDKLGLDKIPNLKEYENLIKNSFEKIKQKRRDMNDIIYEQQKELGKSRKELLIDKIDANLDFLKNFENNLSKRNKGLGTS